MIEDFEQASARAEKVIEENPDLETAMRKFVDIICEAAAAVDSFVGEANVDRDKVEAAVMGSFRDLLQYSLIHVPSEVIENAYDILTETVQGKIDVNGAVRKSAHAPQMAANHAIIGWGAFLKTHGDPLASGHDGSDLRQMHHP